MPANASTGDAMVDVNGYADGYTLPGSLGTDVLDYSQQGGSPAGTEMECSVLWSALGVPYGWPIYYHVSSSNNGTLNSAMDNCGGAGGGLGAFGFHAGSITAAPASQGTAPGGTVTYTITLQNTGTFMDTYNLTASSSMSYGVFLSPTSVSNLAAGATATITLTVPASLLPAAAVDTTTVQATCGGDGSISPCSVTTYVGTVTLSASASKTAVAGNTASYPLSLTNMLATDRFNFTSHSTAGFRIDLYAGATLIATSLTGNGTWNSITSGYDVDGNGQPDVSVTSGTAQALTAVITPPGGTATGTVDTTSLGASGFTNGGSSSAALTTTVEPRLLVTPTSHTQYAGSGTTIYFAHTLLNSWSSADSFGFPATSTRRLSHHDLQRPER